MKNRDNNFKIFTLYNVEVFISKFTDLFTFERLKKFLVFHSGTGYSNDQFLF